MTATADRVAADADRPDRVVPEPSVAVGGRLLERMTTDGYEQVLFCVDPRTGLRSIIAIHDTTLGPALGGVRMHPYSSEEEGLLDALRLARAMTYKAAVAGVNLGGGKSVIFGDPTRDKTPELLRAHGRFIQTLAGRYIPGIDIGTEQADMEVIALEAARVSCIGPDPSPMTAIGVLEAIRAAVHIALDRRSLEGVRIAVQGVGHVGADLARRAAAEGAEMVVADIRPGVAVAIADEIGAEVIDPAAVVTAPCDVLAPCAMGGAITAGIVPHLRCSVIAGAANNVLDDEQTAVDLASRAILFVPDYVANAGGIIFLEEQLLGHDRTQTERRIRGVGDATRRVVQHASERATTPLHAARTLAEERLAARRHLGPAYIGEAAP